MGDAAMNDMNDIVTNEDVLKLTPYEVRHLSPEMHEWIMCNYTRVRSDPGNADWEWETACRAGNDWKYGRYKICRARMLWRDLSQDEFYGGGEVD